MTYYNRYSLYLGKTFGYPVKKVVLDAGFTCPNRDGSVGLNGCIFCNNAAFTHPLAQRDKPLAWQIEQQLALGHSRNPNARYLAYFQPYTNTYATPEELARVYNRIEAYKDIVGLIVATRADEVDADRLQVLQAMAQKGYYVSVELGVQTFKDETLMFVNRGHLADAICQAAELVHAHDLVLGGHVILGLPGENEQDWLNTARQLSRLRFNTLKIHQLQVFSGTRLERLYHAGQVQLLTAPEYLQALVRFIEHLSPDIVISRLFAEAHKDYLVAPKWRADKQKILRTFDLLCKTQSTYQGKCYQKENDRKPPVRRAC